MGLRRSVRLNATISGAASPPRVSTMGTTTVATSVATRGVVHGTFTTARAVSSKAYDIKATTQVVPSKFARAQAQASHSHASHTKQPVPAKQPALVAQPAPAKQPALAAQPAPAKQPALVTQPVPAKQPALVAQPALVTQPAPDEQPTPVVLEMCPKTNHMMILYGHFKC
ncbi:hypothetical protein ACFX15_013109 [Malus domestica]